MADRFIPRDNFVKFRPHQPLKIPTLQEQAEARKRLLLAIIGFLLLVVGGVAGAVYWWFF